MLKITNLHVSITGTPIVKGLNLEVQAGTIHALMGPNGSGKSTLAYALMGHPKYEVTQGQMVLCGQELGSLSPDKRAKLGLFLAFQHPLEVAGVGVATFLKEAHQIVTGTQQSVAEFNAFLVTEMSRLGMDQSFALRQLNDGFSGGEKKRLEILQMLILKPQCVILDEIDSGLDIDALKAVAAAIVQARRDNPAMSVIIITHYQRMLEYLKPDHVHIVRDGVISTSGTAQLVNQLELKGYDGIL
jgi:Fe-S cluster assembly ATP-binding protein